MHFKYFLSASLVFLGISLQAQDYKSTFSALIKKDYPDATISHIRKWQKAEPNNPEVYVAFVNIYAKEGFKEVLALTPGQPAEKSFEIKDKNNRTVAYLSGTSSYNEAYLEKALAYVDTAITKFPNRLDIRFGKTYILGQVKNYQAFTDELVRVIDYGNTIRYQWVWAENKTMENGHNFMLGTIQDYIVQLHKAGPSTMNYIGTIATEILKYDPNDIPNLSNLAISHLIKKEYDKALPPLLKAEKLNPNDVIVLNNIAYCYQLLGNKPEAVKYYQQVLQLDNDEEKENAKEHLAQLQKN